MNRLINALNENSNEYIIATDLKEIKELLQDVAYVTLGAGAKKSSDSVGFLNNVYVQYPDRLEDMHLSANSEYTRTDSINRRLKQISISVPFKTRIELYNNNSLFAWFVNEKGTLNFDLGLPIENFTVKVKNDNNHEVRWTLKLVLV